MNHKILKLVTVFRLLSSQ